MRIEQLSMNDIDALGEVLVPARFHRFGQSEEVDGHIDVMNQEVENATAALARIVQPLAPERCGTTPPENCRAYQPKRATGHGAAQADVRRHETEHMRGHDHLARAFRLAE